MSLNGEIDSQPGASNGIVRVLSHVAVSFKDTLRQTIIGVVLLDFVGTGFRG